MAELKTVRRQTNEDYRRAITAISEGSLPGANGKTRFQEGLEILDGVGAIKEAEGKDRYTQIAADYLSITAQRKLGGKAKTAIVISPTHAESDKVTQQIREALKAAGKIKGQEGKYRSLRALGFTEAQRGDFGNYMPGQVVRWNQNARNFIRGEAVTVTSAKPDRLEVTKANGTAATVLLKDAKRFDVFQEREIALAAGDKVRITMNGKSRETRRGVKTANSKLNNGDVFEVKKLLPDGDIETINGFVIPKNYGGIINGFVITSHASQGKRRTMPWWRSGRNLSPRHIVSSFM